MTATATRPRGTAGSPSDPGPPNSNSPVAGGLADDPFLGSALALTALTVVTALGMGRLFRDGSFIDPLLLTALACHATAWLGRRLGLGLPAGIALTFGALGLTIAWVVLPHTTAYGIPWVGTWTAATSELSDSYAQFSKVVAPAPVTKGFLMAAMTGVGITAVLADWAAYRVRTTFEPLLPAFTLFLFASALGASKHRGLATGAFVAAVLLFLVVHQAAMRAETTAWFASRTRGGVGALLQGGALLAAVAVLASVVIGPNLPGAGSKALLGWRPGDGGGGKDRVTTSPLVDIAGRIVDQPNIEVFQVKSTARSYWHLTTLDTFNGSIWSSNKSYQRVKERIPGGISDKVEADRIVQEFSISGLSSIWLPTAYKPVKIEGVKGVSYNRDLGSLISENETSNGLAYKVESVMPEFRPEQLRTAARPDPDDPFLELPRISQDVLREARRVTEGATTQYDKALALQNYFRNGFAYTTDIKRGHGERALSEFLFKAKKGYCEQFAGAYAVMARAVGLPARVAVGFTPGELERDGYFHVRGINAHAWPEVMLGEFGWVSFEPTPGRGRPGAEAYTGVPELQEPPQGGTATTLTPTTATTTPTGQTTPTTRRGETDPGGEIGDLGIEQAPNPWIKPLVVVALVILLWCIGLPLLHGRRRARRRAAASNGAERVVVSWNEACDTLARVAPGAARRPAETVHEYAARGPAAAGFGSSGPVTDAMRDLAAQTAAASYAGGSLPTESVSRSIVAATAVEAAAGEKAGLLKRLQWKLDPRPLIPRRTSEITGKAGSRRAA